jgi:hypothetical protein
MSRQYGLLDAARDPAIAKLVKSSGSHVCLFAGRITPELGAVAPYLVDLSTGTQLVEAWRTNGWANNWGILLRSAAGIEELRRSFRQFLLAKLPDGTSVMFRFYDPRILRVFLPTCNADELRLWFAAVEIFTMPGQDGGSVTYSFDGAQLLCAET